MSGRRSRLRFGLVMVLLLSACGGGGGATTGKGGVGGGGGGGGAGGGSGAAGASGRGGATGAAGAGGAAGVAGTDGGAGASGIAGAGGTSGTGGASATGGNAGSGGTSGTAGSFGPGGATGAAGSAGTVGAAGAGGTADGGGAGGGDAAGAGGAPADGGAAGTGGLGGTTGVGGTGGSAGSGGVDAGGQSGSGGTGGSCRTSVSGTVYDPAGKLPLYNVTVYSPTAPLDPILQGAASNRCGPLSGSPAAVTVSDVEGKFRLEGIPSGTNVPLVFQVGKWRRQIVVPNVAACADTPLTDGNLTRLPRTEAEGHIPKIAVSTGGADALECFLRRIGIADSEFSTDGSPGRVHLYAGGDGGNSFSAGGTFAPATTLWSNPAKLATYDAIAFSCEGSTSKFADQKPQTSIDNVVAYADSGGRLLFTHLHSYWLQRAAAFSGTATYGALATPPGPIALTINQTFPKGAALAQWLAGPAMNASTTLGQVLSAAPEHTVTSVNAPTIEWLYLPSNPNAEGRRSVQVLSFLTPVGMPEASQLGKVVFADMHVAASDGAAGGDNSEPVVPFPMGCKTNDSTAMMKALELLFFDLTGCL